MYSEGAVGALRSLFEEMIEDIKKSRLNWYTAFEKLTSEITDIAWMFKCYEISEAFAFLSLAKVLLHTHFEKIVADEALKRIDSPEYALPEPFKSMFEREVHRLDIKHFDKDLVPSLSRLEEDFMSVHLLREASKAHGTAYEYQLLKLLLDSSKPATEELNGLFKGFLEEFLVNLERNPNPDVFRDTARSITRELHRKVYGWPDSSNDT